MLTATQTDKAPTTENQRRELVRRERRGYHQAWLESKGLKASDFTVKMSWSRNGIPVIGVFEDEGNRPGGLYIELTDKNHDLLEPGKVYWIRPNPHFKTELEQNDKGTAFYMPVDELSVVLDPEQEKKIEQEIEELTQKHTAVRDDADEHFNKMTIRDLAAILLKKPVSNKTWLNNLINTNK
jgi:hypothetical protein